MARIGNEGFPGTPGNEVVQYGSWTPTIIGSSTAGTQTYSVQVGRYIKIGQLVIVWGVVTITAKDAAIAGNVLLGGLPFTSSNVSNLLPIGVFFGHGLTLTASYTQVAAQILVNDVAAEIAQMGSAQSIANITVANLAAASTFRVTLAYLTNSI